MEVYTLETGSVIVVFTISVLFGLFFGLLFAWTIFKKEYSKNKDYCKKIKSYYDLINYWLMCKQKKRNLITFLTKKGYKTIAIYGGAELGERLVDELLDTEIIVKCIIDRRKISQKKVPVISVNDYVPEVDVIVITAVHYFSEIAEQLRKKYTCDIVSLEDVIYAEF